MAAVTDDAREQQLAWEARQRPRAGIAAIVAAVLTLAGYMWSGLALRDAPRAGFLESLGRRAERADRRAAEPRKPPASSTTRTTR